MEDFIFCAVFLVSNGYSSIHNNYDKIDFISKFDT